MEAHRIGVISDTHGMFRPEVQTALQGVECIVHAGDVGKPEVLDRLREIAPTVAVRGNVDSGMWAQGLHRTEVVDVGAQMLYIIHDRYELDLDPIAAGFRVVISGHSHRPQAEEKDGVLYLNPGSAGPRRFGLPVMLARLVIRGDDVKVEWVELDKL